MKKLLLTLIGLINFCFADRVPHLFILHLNGINTTEQEAIDNAEALRRDVPLKSNMLTFSYVWNPSADEKTGEGISNLLSNLVDVKDQKKYEYITQLSLEDCTDAWMKVNPWDRYPKGTPEYDKVKENIIPKYKDMLEKLSGENFDPIVNNFHNTVPAPFKSVTSLLETPYTQKPRYSEYDILSPATANLHNGANDRVLTEIELDKLTQHNQRQAEELNQDAMARLGMTSSKNYLDTKNMVILVPHSQGNLYANELYNYLTGVEHFPPNQIAIFGIASPASKNVGDWMVKELQSIDYKKKWGNLTSYITSTHDHVMDLVRITHPGEVLPSNISGLSNESDHYAGHNLINVYLKNESSREQIVKMISLMTDYFGNQMVYNRSFMKKLDLSMAGFHYNNASFATFTTLTNGAGKRICSGVGCSSDVLYVSNLDNDYAIDYFGHMIFPKSSFPYNDYRVSYTVKNGSGQMMLTFPDVIPIVNYQFNEDGSGRILPNSFINVFPPCKGPDNTCYEFSI